MSCLGAGFVAAPCRRSHIADKGFAPDRNTSAPMLQARGRGPTTAQSSIVHSFLRTNCPTNAWTEWMTMWETRRAQIVAKRRSAPSVGVEHCHLARVWEAGGRGAGPCFGTFVLSCYQCGLAAGRHRSVLLLTFVESHRGRREAGERSAQRWVVCLGRPQVSTAAIAAAAATATTTTTSAAVWAAVAAAPAAATADPTAAAT